MKSTKLAAGYNKISCWTGRREDGRTAKFASPSKISGFYEAVNLEISLKVFL